MHKKIAPNWHCVIGQVCMACVGVCVCVCVCVCHGVCVRAHDSTLDTIRIDTIRNQEARSSFLVRGRLMLLELYQGFGFEVVCQRGSLIYLFLNGNLAVLLFKF